MLIVRQIQETLNTYALSKVYHITFYRSLSVVDELTPISRRLTLDFEVSRFCT